MVGGAYSGSLVELTFLLTCSQVVTLHTRPEPRTRSRRAAIMPPEVTITWAEPRKSSPYTLARSSIKDDDGEMPLEPGSLSNSDKSDRSSSEPLSMPTLLQRLMWRHSVLFNTAQELTLLLLIGMGTTAVVYSVDKSIDVMLKWRMNTRLSWHVAGGFLPEYLVWIGSSMLLCTLSAACVHLIGPCAAGSGIPLMKCVLSGAQMDDYISFRTLVAKATSLAFAYSGGLSVGKEGPFVHMASCVAHQMCQLPIFRRVAQNEHLHRQVLAAACAAGVSAAFGSPVGGVLFSIEVTSTYYSISHLWKAFFTAVCGTLFVRLVRAYGSLANFRITDFSVQVRCPSLGLASVTCCSASDAC
jgi:H+/Cl- antiporter ClcA